MEDTNELLFQGKVNARYNGQETLLVERRITWLQAWWWKLMFVCDKSIPLTKPFDFTLYEGEEKLQMMTMLTVVGSSTDRWRLSRLSFTRPVYLAQAVVKTRLGWRKVMFRYIDLEEVEVLASRVEDGDFTAYL